jgi:hypothetical protein
MTPLLTLPEAAEVLGTTPHRLWMRSRAGKVPTVRIGTNIRFRARDVDLPEDELRDVVLDLQDIRRILRLNDVTVILKYLPFKQWREPELAAWIEERVR